MTIDKWLGLWDAKDKNDIYIGQAIKKETIPNIARIIVCRNSQFFEGSGRPRYVYGFLDSSQSKKVLNARELDKGRLYHKDLNGKRLYTHEEVTHIMRSAIEDVLCNPYIDINDIMVEDYIEA